MSVSSIFSNLINQTEAISLLWEGEENRNKRLGTNNDICLFFSRQPNTLFLDLVK